MLGEGWKHSLLPRKHQIQSEPHAGQRRVVTWSHEANRCLQMASERRYRPSCQPPNLRQGVACCRMFNFSYDIYIERYNKKRRRDLGRRDRKNGKKDDYRRFFFKETKVNKPCGNVARSSDFLPCAAENVIKKPGLQISFSLVIHTGISRKRPDLRIIVDALRSRQRALDKNLIS